MSSTFLTSSNAVTSNIDNQFAGSDAMSCRLILEAVLRRMVVIHGSHRAAVLAQQKVDVLAVHDLRSVDHWRSVK